MTKLKNVKKWIWIPILLILIALTVVTVFALNDKISDESLFNLSERDVVLEIGESQKVELESEIKVNTEKLDVSWKSSKPSVANVDKDGNIVATAGGETKITAVIEYKGKTYITSCVVTVKSEDNEYSVYKIRWYTQKQDRSSYELKEETYERLIGSSVELTVADAKKNLPANYVLNEEKSTLTGTVKENLNGCILEVYFDVAEISYTVDYYYESDTKLGTYPTKETKKYTAYAFTKVQVTDAPKTGFSINQSVKGTVMSNDSVVSGSKLKVFCDRARSKVTVSYLSGRASATYDCIYGIGLLNAPDDVFTDSAEYKITTYVNGAKKKATKELMKKVTADTTVAFGLDGVGFTYSLKDGKSTITNTCSTKKTPCYAMLNGSSDTIYLSATYTITGSTSNRFGITLSNGKTSRQIRFYKQGFAIMADNTTTGGIPTAQDTTNALRNATRYIGNFNGQNAYVWAQNTTGSSGSKTTEVSSVITDMLRNKAGGSYEIEWAVAEGVLYCTVEGQPVLRLPLACLDTTWTADQKYQIGFSTYDGSAWEDNLQITNVDLKLGSKAEAKLHLDGDVLTGASKYMVYEPITGSYLPAVKNASSGAAYIYGEEKIGNAGVSAKIAWIDTENTASAVGISVKVGEQSVEYLVQGQNSKIRRQENQKYANNVLKITAPFENGSADVKAFVKDGYFYVMYNGTQVQCINMLSLFPDYNMETSEVSIGFSFWDANLGLASISEVTELDATAVAAVTGATEWGFYSESLSADAYSFEEASITKTKSGNKIVTLLGSNATWQVDGTMARPAKENATDTEEDLNMGFLISSGDEGVRIVGTGNGFKIQQIEKVDGSWKAKSGAKWKTYKSYNDSYNSTKYAFNTIVTDKFFNSADSATRTQNELDFKAVLYNDTLYVWFTDESENSGLCWRIPLIEFGGFAEETEYEMALYMLNSVNSQAVTGYVKNLDVKMGCQVTGQTEFLPSGVDENGNTTYHSFYVAEADRTEDIQTILDIVDANIDRWDGTFRLKTISGMFAEKLDTSWKFGDTMPSKPNGAVYAYLDGSSSDIYLSATYELDSTYSQVLNTDETAKFFGISMKDENGQSRQIYYHTNGVYLYLNYDFEYSDDDGNTIPAMYTSAGAERNKKYYTDIVAGTIWAQQTSQQPYNTVYTMIKNQKQNGALTDYDVKWAITDGYLYGMVDGFVFLKMSVTDLCKDWNADTTFQIGFAQYNIYKQNGSGYNSGDVVTTKNIEALYGEAALAKMVKNNTLNSSSNMAYEVINGSYLPYPTSGAKTCFGVAISETQALKTTINLTDTTVTDGSLAYGIAIKTATSGTAYIDIKANGSTIVLRQVGTKTKSIQQSSVGTSVWNNGVCNLTAVINNGTLYIFLNDVLAGSVELQNLMPKYQTGDGVILGLCAKNPNLGLATFSNVTLETGATAIEGLNLANAPKWVIE